MRDNYRQTISWEAYLSKYVRFQRSKEEQQAKVSDVQKPSDGGVKDFDDGSSVQTFKRKYNFYVSEVKVDVTSNPNQSNSTQS